MSNPYRQIRTLFDDVKKYKGALILDLDLTTFVTDISQKEFNLATQTFARNRIANITKTIYESSDDQGLNIIVPYPELRKQLIEDAIANNYLPIIATGGNYTQKEIVAVLKAIGISQQDFNKIIYANSDGFEWQGFKTLHSKSLSMNYAKATIVHTFLKIHGFSKKQINDSIIIDDNFEHIGKAAELGIGCSIGVSTFMSYGGSPEFQQAISLIAKKAEEKLQAPQSESYPPLLPQKESESGCCCVIL